MDKPVQWRTPDGIMRKIRLRKLKDQKVRRSSLSTISLNTSAKNSESDDSATKFKNPFAKKRSCSETSEATKKRILSVSEFEKPVEVFTNLSDQCDSLSDITDGSNSSDAPTSCDPPVVKTQTSMPFIYLEEDSIQGIFSKNENLGEKITENAPQGTRDLPLDWTIKRKARFLSSASFTWCSRVKGAEEASSVTEASRCRHKIIPPKPNFGPPSEETQKSWKIELGKCVTYWQQPAIPWLNLFPRFGQSVKLHSAATPPVPQTENVQKSFHDAWVTSFRSVYQLTREKLCPYFYVCAQQYTALFRAPTVSLNTEITCVLTPTTSGLRQILKSEGIDFSMPADEELKPTSEGEDKENDEGWKDSLDNEAETENPPNLDESADESTWDLINENINFTGVKELARHNIHSETSTKNTIIITGVANTQLFFNYLINSKNSISKSGPQAFVPPTILSPVAFQGAALQKLNIRSGIARSCSEMSSRGQNSQRQFSLDVSGPLLPHCIISLTELLKNTQGFEGFKAAFSTSLYTAPLNCKILSKNTDAMSENRPNCSDFSANPNDLVRESLDLTHSFGVSQKCVGMLQNPNSELVCLNQLSLSNGLYTWNS